MKGGANLSTQTYAYDRYGNRTSVAATGTAADNSAMPVDGLGSLAFDAASNRITTAGFQYDAAGNQTRSKDKDGTSWIKFEYDAANRLKFVRSDNGTNLQSFEYGSSSERLTVHNYAANRKTLYVGQLAEYEESTANVPSWTKSYVYFGNKILSKISKSGNAEATEYHHPDRLGTRVVTGQAGGTSGEQTTLPFGTAVSAETTTSQNRKFTSYDRSGQTGLDYAVNRTYDPKQGRFTQVDQIGISVSSLIDPQTLNLYIYAGNDPINHTDPDGLFFGRLFKWIGKAFKAILKVLRIVVAVVTAVVSIVAFAIGQIKAGVQLALMSANLWGQVAGNKTLQRITAIASIAVSSSRKFNTPPTFPFAGDEEERDSSTLPILFGVGAIANSFISGGKGEEDDDGVIDGGTTSCPADLSIVTALCPGQPSKTRVQMLLGGFRDKLKKPIIKVPGLSIDRLWIVNNVFTPAVSIGGIPFLGAGNTIKTMEVKVGLHNAHHPFPYIGKWSHFQIITYTKGVPGTTYIPPRIPLLTKHFMKKDYNWIIKKGQNLSLKGRK